MPRFILLISLVVCSSLPASAQDAPRGAAESITFDFESTDIGVVITAIARAGGLNVTFSDLPPRPVTLRMSTPIARANVLAVLRSVVEGNGLAMEEGAGLLHVRAVAVEPPGATVEPGAPIALYVYRLKHAPAAQLAATVQSLFGGGTVGYSQSRLSSSSLTSQLRSQRILLPTDPAEPVMAETGTLHTAELEGQLQIVPDELTNSLLVRSSAADWDLVRQAIDLLDLRPLQVLIEVMIAEVRRSSIEDFGISVAAPRQVEPSTGATISGSLAGTSAGDLVLEVLDLGNVKADVVLSALSSRSDVSILSRPVVLAQNNQEAHIHVGSERPFVQVFRSLPTDGGVRDQVVQYRDVGTSLRIRPTINLDGYVSLDILQEVSTATAETQFGAPVISTREASTRLFVRDGQTAVIGGLVDTQKDRGRSGVPLLKDIPILGRLFGSSSSRSYQTELFLFITPRIVSSDEDIDNLREGIEGGSELIRRVLPTTPLIPPASTPDGNGR